LSQRISHISYLTGVGHIQGDADMVLSRHNGELIPEALCGFGINVRQGYPPARFREFARHGSSDPGGRTSYNHALGHDRVLLAR
jgi:hypothetical protein